MPILEIDRRTVKALQPSPKLTVYYDKTLKGFGLRMMPSGYASWIVEYRPAGGGRGVHPRRMVIGSVANLKADEARAAAQKILASVELGADPAGERQVVRAAETVDELLATYLEDRIKPKGKPATLALFKGYVANHIRPVLGAKKALLVTRGDVARLHRTIGAASPPTANRVVSMLRAAFSYGSRSGLLPAEHPNPAAKADAFPERARERYLSGEEISRLGDTLRLAETEGLPWEPDPDKNIKHAPRLENRRVIIDPGAIAAIRLLLLTGARLREILHLRWAEVDIERGALFLADSKTGRKTILLGKAAIEILLEQPRRSDFVFPGTPRRETTGQKTVRIIEKPRSDLNRPWARIAKHAGLAEVRLHDLRHSFASVGAGAGLGLPVIGKLLGHASQTTTARYAHLADDPTRRAADAISGAIWGRLQSEVDRQERGK